MSLMSLLQSVFRRPDYRSEATQFIDQLKVTDPELAARQRQGRELLWDKTINRQTRDEFQTARVKQNPYVYQTDMK